MLPHPPGPRNARPRLLKRRMGIRRCVAPGPNREQGERPQKRPERQRM